MPVMNAVQVAEPGADLALVRREIPEPGDREVLIKVEACGVCHGDALAETRPFPGIAYPRVPGHEVVGTVAKRGPAVTGWEPGTRVGVGWSGGYCMTCDACAAGDYQNCEDSWATGLSVDGGYAEYMVARTSALVQHPGRAVLRRCRAAAVRGRDDLQRPEGQRGEGRRHRGDPRHRRTGAPGDPVRQPARLQDGRPVARTRQGIARPQARRSRLHRHGVRRRRQGTAGAGRGAGDSLHGSEREGHRRADQRSRRRAGS